MRSALASLTFESNERRHFELPADGTPSLLYVFSEDRKLGARAHSATGQAFAPGVNQEHVRLDFWADDEWTDIVQPGASFTIWYGGDVGRGFVEEIV